MNNALITTLHFYNNYGSVLQAYAMKKVLENRFGFNADFFPFRPKLPEYRYFQSESLLDGYNSKCEKFNRFRMEILGLIGDGVEDQESAYRTLGKTSADYKAFLVGSDIVWGREFSLLAEPYFLSHAGDKTKRIAYAASVILDADGQTENDELFIKHLSTFTAVGVRETSAVNPIKKLAGDVGVEAVLDPTLLLNASDYAEIEADVSDYMGKPYLLSYFLTHDPAVVDYTNVIARKMDLRILHYFADYPDRVFSADSKSFAFTGPGEFLSLVKNAKMVFTNSFHGTCFSIIYRKPFYTYMAKRNMLSRVRDTVSRIGLENRFFTDFRDLKNVTMDINYYEVDVKIDDCKKKSIDFLARALGVHNV